MSWERSVAIICLLVWSSMTEKAISVAFFSSYNLTRKSETSSYMKLGHASFSQMYFIPTIYHSIFGMYRAIRFIFGTIIAKLSCVQLSAQLQGAADSQNIENQLLKAVIMDVICKKRQRQGYVCLSNIYEPPLNQPITIH